MTPSPGTKRTARAANGLACANVREGTNGAMRMITDFELHAFADGEISAEQRAHILQVAAASPALRRQLDQLQRLKDLVRASYQDAANQGGEPTQCHEGDAFVPRNTG